MTKEEPAPDPAAVRRELRATLAAFDDRQRKVVGGLIALMIESPGRVKDREWILEQLTHVALLSANLDDVASPAEGVERVRTWVRANVDPVLNASFRLFQVSAEDLAPRVGSGVTPGVTRDEALAHALGYLAPEGEAR